MCTKAGFIMRSKHMKRNATLHRKSHLMVSPATNLQNNKAVFLEKETLNFVNGSFATAPFSLRNGSIQVYQSGFSVIVSTDFGLMVSYDMYSYVQIAVPYTYQNSTCGLCGNFNNRPEDDFRTRQGEVVSSDVVFANSWKAAGDDEPGCDAQCSGLACAGCTAAQTALYRNSAHCGILENSTGPFAACHQQLAPGSFVDSCVYDLCVSGGYQPILCQALNVYSSQCQQNGIQPQSWRSSGFCEIPCPGNSHYEAQGTGCPSTCVNPNSTNNCPLPNQESCVCNSGYLLSGGVCVPHSDCGCSFEGHYYRSGETVILDADCGRRCTCSYGSMTCSSHSCGQHESCRVEGPGSYNTFDGVMYQYPGACRLILAKVIRFSNHSHFMVTVEKVPQGPQVWLCLKIITLLIFNDISNNKQMPKYVDKTKLSVHIAYFEMTLSGLVFNLFNQHNPNMY
uniref:VWFD domain-containing protein n=1 Tax=Xiphophorus couchianus TaxID=32473 RepID=A0A3B5LMQ0_9TELE